MDPITVETSIQMSTHQFITLLIVLVFNTSAIVAAWYRFGFRISKVENDQLATRQEIIDLKAKNTLHSHSQLRKEYDNHVCESRKISRETTEKLDAIKDVVNGIAEKLNTHVEIHKDRERNLRNPRRKPPNNED